MLAKPSQSEFTLLHTADASIYTLAYNGFFKDYKALFHIMELQDMYLQTHSASSMKVCTLFYNTRITPEVMDRYIAQLGRHTDQFDTVAIVGVPVPERGIFRLKLKKSLARNMQFHFFYSVEEASQFLKN